MNKNILKTEHFYACELVNTKELYAYLGIDKQSKLSVSSFGSACGHSIWETPNDCADATLGFAPPKAEKLLGQARRGIDREPIAIKVYEKLTGNVALKPFYAHPVWNKRIGGISDAFCKDDGMLEVKCPDKIWKSVEVYMNYKGLNPVNEKVEAEASMVETDCDEIFKQMREINNDSIPIEKVEIKEEPWVQTENSDIVPPEFSHIPHYYYDQIQGYMAIFNRKWCDFFVYCEPQNKFFLQRVPFNELYWKDLHKKINHYLDVILPERKRYHENRLKLITESKRVVNIPNI
jgi:hypothetical protein